MEPAQDDDVEAAAVAVEETELVPVLAARPTAVAEKDDLGFNSDISMRTYIMDTLRGRPFASTERRRNPREAARRVGKGGRRLVAEQTPAPDARGTPQVPHGQHARDVHGRGHVPRVRAAALESWRPTARGAGLEEDGASEPTLQKSAGADLVKPSAGRRGGATTRRPGSSCWTSSSACGSR